MNETKELQNNIEPSYIKNKSNEKKVNYNVKKKKRRSVITIIFLLLIITIIGLAIYGIISIVRYKKYKPYRIYEEKIKVFFFY